MIKFKLSWWKSLPFSVSHDSLLSYNTTHDLVVSHFFRTHLGIVEELGMKVYVKQYLILAKGHVKQMARSHSHKAYIYVSGLRVYIRIYRP
jgi:hypothetical protein